MVLAAETLKPGVILITPDHVRCQIDSIHNNKLYMTVLDNHIIHGENAISMTLKELQDAQWELAPQVAH